MSRLRIITIMIMFVLPACAGNAYAAAERLILPLETRPGVTVKVLLQTPDVPSKGTILLFPGGSGARHFGGSGSGISLGNNFLVRSSGLFVQKGYATAIIDAPSDHADGMSDAFRASPEHAQDILKIMDALAIRSAGPFYLAGTSRGTLSAAYLASVLPQGQVAALVLTATLGSVGSLPLDAVSVPVLLVHHIQDDCRASSPADAAALTGRFVKSSQAVFVEAAGGSSGSDGGRGKRRTGGAGGPCSALTHHGFLGMEDKVVTVITEWLSGKPAPKRISD